MSPIVIYRHVLALSKQQVVGKIVSMTLGGGGALLLAPLHVQVIAQAVPGLRGWDEGIGKPVVFLQ